MVRDQKIRAMVGTLLLLFISAAFMDTQLNGFQRSGKMDQVKVSENEDQILISTSAVEAAIRKQGYVSGVAKASFLDKKTGFRDVGFGLDIVDWLLEPGTDEAYRDKLDPELVYLFGLSHPERYHGNIPKRSIEGPQICTRARKLTPEIIQGKDFVAVRSRYKYYLAAPGKEPGSQWTQTIVFPAGRRYFVSSDRIDTVNSSEAMILRIDMPGHVRHNHGDTFSEVYLSYHGRIPSSEFFTDFPPDAKFLYRRENRNIPKRFIRAYHLRDSKTGKDGPWLAGMTLDPAVVYQAWCHERGYLCMIEEFGGRRVRPGDSFSAAFIVGYFDSIKDMNKTYDLYAGHNGLEADQNGWRLNSTAGSVAKTKPLWSK